MCAGWSDPSSCGDSGWTRLAPAEQDSAQSGSGEFEWARSWNRPPMKPPAAPLVVSSVIGAVVGVAAEPDVAGRSWLEYATLVAEHAHSAGSDQTVQQEV